MLIDGHGLLARAFATGLDPDRDAYVFARGVADSGCADPEAFAREMARLDAALEVALAQGIPLVYFSGAPVYGRFTGPVDEESPLRPITPYGAHKARVEDRIRHHAAPHLIIRLPNVVGPGAHERQLVPSLIHQVRMGVVRVQEQAARDLIHAEDVARCVDRLLAAEPVNRTVIIASGQSTPVTEITDWITQELRLSPRREVIPSGEVQQFRVDLLRSLAPSVSEFDAGYPRTLITQAASEMALRR